MKNEFLYVKRILLKYEDILLRKYREIDLILIQEWSDNVIDLEPIRLLIGRENSKFKLY